MHKHIVRVKEHVNYQNIYVMLCYESSLDIHVLIKLV